MAQYLSRVRAAVTRLTFILATIVALSLAVLAVEIAALGRVTRLEARVRCLEHPSGASSVAGRMVDGRFVVTRPVARTGCR